MPVAVFWTLVGVLAANLVVFSVGVVWVVRRGCNRIRDDLDETAASLRSSFDEIERMLR